MNLTELIPIAIALVSLLGALYDLYLKWKKNQRAYGPSSGRIVALLLIVVALAVGWLGGQYSQKKEIARLEQDVAKREAENQSLLTQSTHSMAQREQSIIFFQNQMQILSDEIDRLKGGRQEKVSPRVILFEHTNYQGKRFYFGIGEHPNLMLYWFGGKASSVKLQGKVKAVAYEYTNFNGDFLPVDRNIPSLVSSGWDNRISSVKVIGK